MSVNPCQEPTPLQEMRQNWADEVAALKEQIVEAYFIISNRDFEIPGMTMRVVEWLDQNESIVKETP